MTRPPDHDAAAAAVRRSLVEAILLAVDFARSGGSLAPDAEPWGGLSTREIAELAPSLREPERSVVAAIVAIVARAPRLIAAPPLAGATVH
jgi:hypothetical protein